MCFYKFEAVITSKRLKCSFQIKNWIINVFLDIVSDENLL